MPEFVLLVVMVLLPLESEDQHSKARAACHREEGHSLVGRWHMATAVQCTVVDLVPHDVVKLDQLHKGSAQAVVKAAGGLWGMDMEV